MRNFNVKVNGKTYFVEVEETDGTNVTAQSVPQTTAQTTPTAQSVTKQPVAKAAGSHVVVSPFPGLILDLSVSSGASVKKSDKILVLEAMKMQHDIMAGADGTVTFLVKKGDSVETGTEIAYIK